MFSDTLKTTPLWQEDYTTCATPAAEFPNRADVVVIGSGYTGSSTALTLADSGIDVVVLEAKELGHGASTRNFGYAMGPENRGRYAGRYSEREVDSILASYAAAGDHTKSLVDRFGTKTVEARSEGQLVVAHSQKAAAALQKSGPLSDTQTYFDRDALSEVIGSPVFHGGIVSREATALHPGKMHAALAGHAIEAGAKFFDHCPANAIRKYEDGYIVTTPHGEITCSHVALATNGHSGKVNSFLRKRILPVVGTVIATEKLPADLAKSLLPQMNWCADTQFGFRCFRLSPDGTRMVFAKAGLPGSFTSDTRPYAKRVFGAMVETFPQLAGTKLDYAWPASVAVTFDALPHLGQQDGIWFAGGYNGHGIAMSHYLGHMMAKRILGDKQDRLFVEEKSFSTSMFYNGSTWFMPLLRQVIKLKGLKS